MAKRAQALRANKEQFSPNYPPHANGHHPPHHPPSQHHHRNPRERRASHPSKDASEGDNFEVEIKEARVTRPQASPLLNERHMMSLYRDEALVKEQMELKQFEDFERALSTVPQSKNSDQGQREQVQMMQSARKSPDKSSRDSGIITPSDESSSTNVTSSNESNDLATTAHRKPSDPLPSRPELPRPQPVKAEVTTNEVDLGQKRPFVPPPYHIAAAMSKHAGDFGTPSPRIPPNSNSRNSSVQRDLNTSMVSNGGGHNSRHRHQHQNSSSTGTSDTNSVTGSEVSTVASSLQTIVRMPQPQPQLPASIFAAPSGSSQG